MPFVDNAPPFDPSKDFDVVGGAQPPSLDNFDPDRVDHNQQGWQYLHQFPAEVQAAAKAYMNGDVMPTGNPRNNNITTFAKTVAQKVASDIGQPDLADDALYSQRRKMRTDLGSSSQSSMGGILSNGKSAFEHLGTLSDKMANLGNYNGPNVPGGGLIATIGNLAGNSRATATSQTLDKIQQASDAALKYGQESTKFYSGTGGGEAERMFALKNLDFAAAPSDQQAGFLQTEKELMTARLHQKEQQVRDTLGQEYLDKHPIITPDLEQTLSKIDANIAKLRGQTPQQAAPAASPQIQTGIPQQAPMQQSAQAAQAPAQVAQSGPIVMPKAGTRDGGFIFLGGNPADPNRWQRLRQ